MKLELSQAGEHCLVWADRARRGYHPGVILYVGKRSGLLSTPTAGFLPPVTAAGIPPEVKLTHLNTSVAVFVNR